MTDSPVDLWPLLEPAAKDWFNDQRQRGAAMRGSDYLPSMDGVSACSSAISLKRAADALEAIAKHLEPVIINKAEGGAAADQPRSYGSPSSAARMSIADYVIWRIQQLELDFNSWSFRARDELASAAIAGVKEWVRANPQVTDGLIWVEGDKPSAASPIPHAWVERNDTRWLNAHPLWMPIEVRYVAPDATVDVRMCLGDALEWSHRGVGRVLKASIACWRPLL